MALKLLETFFLVWTQADPEAEAHIHRRLYHILGDSTSPETNEKTQMEALEQASAYLQMNHGDGGAGEATSPALLSPYHLVN